MARKKSRASLGILFWMAFILCVLVVFLINRPRIQTVLENTGFVEVVRSHFNGEEPTDTDEIPELNWEDDPETSGNGGPSSETSDTPSESTDEDTDPNDSEASSDDRVDEGGEEEGEDETDESARSDDADGASERSERSRSTEQESGQESADNDDSSDSSDSSDSPDASDTPEQDEQPDNQEESEPTNELELNLYYVRITDDGAFPEPVERTIEYSDSPLTQTVRTLLQGPTSGEVGDGLLDLIPDGTQLLRASVRNGVAYLDFNDAFRFNPMGVEGYRLQLQQIIYVTTQFSTVDRVQFLIEGERHEWLGGEGVYIGSPLGRSSFS